MRFSRKGLLFLAFSLCTAFPLSNLVLPIGTNIGERLLFSPSVGFCLLVGCVLAWLIRWGSSSSSTHKAASPEGGADATPAPAATATTNAAAVLVRILGVLAFAVALAAYARRTYIRNPDWDTNEALFKSAYEVCPGSAKVNYILGKQVQTQNNDDDLAMRYFERARAEMAPINYCENSIAIGIIHVRKGRIDQGIEDIMSALDCIYTRKEAYELLNSAFSDLFRMHPDDPKNYATWGRVLEKINRTQDAFSFYQSAANKFWDSVNIYLLFIIIKINVFKINRIKNRLQSL